MSKYTPECTKLDNFKIIDGGMPANLFGRDQQSFKVDVSQHLSFS